MDFGDIPKTMREAREISLRVYKEVMEFVAADSDDTNPSYHSIAQMKLAFVIVDVMKMLAIAGRISHYSKTEWDLICMSAWVASEKEAEEMVKIIDELAKKKLN